MTIALEQLADSSISDRNFQTLARLVLDTGGRSVALRFGTGTVTWAGGTLTSANTTITHGLGRTPVGALVTPNIGAWANWVCWAGTPGATTFPVAAWSTTGNPPAATTDTFFWVVIG